MKKKVILSLSVITILGIITYSILNKEQELKIDSKRLAVFIKEEDGSYKESSNIPQVGYTLNIEKSTCSNGVKPTWRNSTLNLSNLTSENTNCYLYFEEDASTKKLKEMGLTSNITTPDFSKIAVEDEGIYAEEDGMYGGTSYYWRGSATTNYLRFGGYCWRIVRINGDGTIRLIYDGATCHNNGEVTTDSVIMGETNSDRYYATSDGQYNKSYYVGWTYVEGKQRPEEGDTEIDSNAKTKTEEWYNTNLASYSDKIAEGKYCNDRNVGKAPSSWGTTWSTTWSENGTKFAYTAVKRIHETYQPTLSCDTGDIYALKVGAITADEVELAGGKGENNTSYYMYTGQHYWTMSPYRWNVDGYAHMFFVNANGYLDRYNVGGTEAGIRPVINLRSDIKLSGIGTIDNPFVVEEA